MPLESLLQLELDDGWGCTIKKPEQLEIAQEFT
jgi:hypothetical protein